MHEMLKIYRETVDKYCSSKDPEEREQLEISILEMEEALRSKGVYF